MLFWDFQKEKIPKAMLQGFGFNKLLELQLNENDPLSSSQGLRHSFGSKCFL